MYCICIACDKGIPVLEACVIVSLVEDGGSWRLAAWQRGGQLFKPALDRASFQMIATRVVMAALFMHGLGSVVGPEVDQSPPQAPLWVRLPAPLALHI